MPVEKNLEFQKRKIFYRIIGEGPAVMLLHGLPFDGNLWKGQLDALTGFRFIVPDLPGSGKSEPIEDMSMEGMAEAVKAILDKEKPSLPAFTTRENRAEPPGNEMDHVMNESSKSEVREWVIPPGEFGRTVMIGHSMGGYISLAFAEKYPNRLKGLGLFHSTAFPDSEERKATRKKGIDFIKKNGAHEFLKTIIPNLFSPKSRDDLTNSIDELIEKTNNFSPQSLVSYYDAMMQRPDRSNVLKLLKIPMLFIAGEYDNAAPLNDVLKLCHLPEISYFHILAQSGHLGMIEETVKSNLILNDYLIKLS
jgi:pimeloyl-ACP methyl ester carboxylesterase